MIERIDHTGKLKWALYVLCFVPAAYTAYLNKCLVCEYPATTPWYQNSHSLFITGIFMCYVIFKITTMPKEQK